MHGLVDAALVDREPVVDAPQPADHASADPRLLLDLAHRRLLGRLVALQVALGQAPLQSSSTVDPGDQGHARRTTGRVHDQAPRRDLLDGAPPRPGPYRASPTGPESSAAGLGAARDGGHVATVDRTTTGVWQAQGSCPPTLSTRSVGAPSPSWRTSPRRPMSSDGASPTRGTGWPWWAARSVTPSWGAWSPRARPTST